MQQQKWLDPRPCFRWWNCVGKLLSQTVKFIWIKCNARILHLSDKHCHNIYHNIQKCRCIIMFVVCIMLFEYYKCIYGASACRWKVTIMFWPIKLKLMSFITEKWQRQFTLFVCRYFQEIFSHPLDEYAENFNIYICRNNTYGASTTELRRMYSWMGWKVFIHIITWYHN